MSYYMGDFYPRGDPGIGSFLGGLVKKGITVAKGILNVAGVSMPGGAKVSPVAGAITKAAGAVGSQIVKHPVLSAAAGAGAAATMGAAAERMIMGGGAHAGKHVLKHCGQTLKSGKIGKCHRRMNPFNPRAARRAGRRIHSLVRHYRKYVGFVSAHKPKGRPYFKARKRK
jgi:hypothetical protein